MRMSSPTPGSEPNPPQGGAPQGQPWGSPPPPPAQGYGYQPAPSYSGGSGIAGRPPLVTAAAVIGIVIGALGILSLLSVGSLFSFNAFLGLLSLLSLAVAIVMLIGGIQALQGKSPRLLLLGSYASIGVQLLTLIWAAVSGWGFLFTGVLGFVLPGLIVFFLLQPQSKQYYASQGMSY
jgi:hypothetical protein